MELINEADMIIHPLVPSCIPPVYPWFLVDTLNTKHLHLRKVKTIINLMSTTSLQHLWMFCCVILQTVPNLLRNNFCPPPSSLLCAVLIYCFDHSRPKKLLPRCNTRSPLFFKAHTRGPPCPYFDTSSAPYTPMRPTVVHSPKWM